VTVEKALSTLTLFDLAIIALRVLKSSGVYRGADIQTEPLTFHLGDGGQGFVIPIPENVELGRKCVLQSHEVRQLQSLFQSIRAEIDERFGEASRRLSFGLERHNTQDRLLDYMIGLEALYLPDSNDELTFRLGLRVAWTLKHTKAERAA